MIKKTLHVCWNELLIWIGLLILNKKLIIRHSRMPNLHDSNFQNVTITWYRLSILMVYPSHTLSTFLTPLNQERWSIVLWSVHIFVIIKSKTMVYRYIVDDIFLFFTREPWVSCSYSWFFRGTFAIDHLVD